MQLMHHRNIEQQHDDHDHYQVVILAYYNIRIVLTLTISLLTAKTILMTLFILRFDAMTGIIIIIITSSAGSSS